MYFLRAIFRFLFIACIQIVRSKMTSLDAIFCSGNKSSSPSLARFCRRKQKKIYRSRFALVHENYATVKINPWEKFQNLRGFECKTTQPWLGGNSCFFLYKSFKSFGGRCNRCFSDIRARSILKPRVWFQTNCTPLSSITIINSISFEFAESLSHDQLLRGPIKLNFMCKKRNSYI